MESITDLGLTYDFTIDFPDGLLILCDGAGDTIVIIVSDC